MRSPSGSPLQALLLAAVALGFLLRPDSVVAANMECRLADDAPEQHQVVRGDTLWEIASRFLRDPWCWPRVWDGNRDAIVNPHLIYPGQRIRLDRARGVLTLADSDDPARSLRVVRLAPTMRATALADNPIPLLPASWLALSQQTPLMSADELSQAPRIVALAAGRRMAGAGDRVYVRNKTLAATQGHASFDVRRPLAPVLDPEDGETIALATRRVGSAQSLRITADGLQAAQLTEAREEVITGDLLLPMPSARPAASSLIPHPATAMQGRVAAVLHEGRWASIHDIVVLNRGRRHGLDAGSVVHVVQNVRIGAHELPQASTPAYGIDEFMAMLLVIDVLDRAALAVVMRSLEPFATGALVVSPDLAGK